MLSKKIKTVLVAGLVLFSVGLAGCDHHGHHGRHMSPGRGHDVHHGNGGRCFSPYEDRSFRAGGFSQADGSGKSQVDKSFVNVFASPGRTPKADFKRTNKSKDNHGRKPRDKFHRTSLARKDARFLNRF